MKNTLKFYSIIAVLVLVAFSCKKKSTDEDIATLPFAKETVNEGKSNLTEAGQQMVTELNGLSDVKGVSGSQSLAHYMDISTPFSTDMKTGSVFGAIEATNSYSEKKNVKSIMNFLSSSITQPDTTLKQVFEKNKGIYTWNGTVWVKTAATDKIELLFPSTKTGTTNNAKLDITYQSKAGSSIVDGLNSDLPTALNISLYTDAEKVLEYSFSAQYDDSGLPTNVNTFLALYPFKFEITANNGSSNASAKYSFTNSDKIIFEFFLGVNGDLSQNNLTASNGPEDVISNANAYFQVFNIKLAGKIDVKGIAQKEKEANQNQALSEKEYCDAQVAAMNEFITLVLIYADSKQKIAQAEFYTKPSTYYGYTYYDSEMRFTFADESKGDLKTYFGNGFSEVITDFNKLLVKLNTNYEFNFKPVNQ